MTQKADLPSDPARISDQIRIIKASRGASDTVVLIQAITRALMALSVILAGIYLIATGVQIPPGAIEIALLVVGAFFGSEALHKFSSFRNGK